MAGLCVPGVWVPDRGGSGDRQADPLSPPDLAVLFSHEIVGKEP